MHNQITDTISALNRLQINESQMKSILMSNSTQSINKSCQMLAFYKNIIDILQKQVPSQASLIYSGLRVFFINLEQWQKYDNLCEACIKYRSIFGPIYSGFKKKMIQYIDRQDIGMCRVGYHKFAWYLKQGINQECDCIQLNSIKVK